jgi:hypothetical protein
MNPIRSEPNKERGTNKEIKVNKDKDQELLFLFD